MVSHPGDRPPIQKLMALNAAKMWLTAAEIWSSNPADGGVESALCLEASLGCGRLHAAQEARRNAGSAWVGLRWFDQLEEDLRQLSELQRERELPSKPNTPAWGLELIQRRRYEEALEFWSQMRGTGLVDDRQAELTLADLYYRLGQFDAASSLASDLETRQGWSEAEQQKLLRIRGNSATRLQRPPVGEGEVTWSSRHPLLAAIQATEGFNDANRAALVEAALQLVARGGSVDLLVHLAEQLTFYNSMFWTCVFQSPTMNGEMLKAILSRIGRRSVPENHSLAAAIISAGRLDMLREVFDGK